VVEMAEECAGVVDADFLNLAGERVLALFDESLSHRADVFDAAVQPHRGVDTMRQEITGDAAAGDLCVKAPEAGTTLRQVWAERPILKEVRAIVEHASELAGINDILRKRNCRATPV